MKGEKGALEEMNEKGTHRIYVSVPERIYREMKEIGLLEEIDMLVTNLVIEEILQKKEKQRNEYRR